MYVEHTKPHLPAGYQGLTVGSTVVALTVPDDARYAVVRAVTEPIRYRDDGTNPTTSVGFSIPTNEKMELTSRQQLTAFRAVRSGATGAVEVLYYKI